MEHESLLTDVEFNPVHASAGQRFVNYLIDSIIFNIILNFVEIIFTIGISRIYASNVFINIFINLLITYIFFVLLYFLSELILKGRTIGKFVSGTKAVNEDGTEMEPKTILVRSLCRLVPFEQFSAFGGHPWHDKLSRTIVVDIKQTTFNSPVL